MLQVMLTLTVWLLTAMLKLQVGMMRMLSYPSCAPSCEQEGGQEAWRGQ
jgi:hypothetical protein